MPSNYGNNVARYVKQGIAKCPIGTWTRLVSSGTTPLAKRQWIEVQAKGRAALAITYTNINADGTFTTPAWSAHQAVIIPANSIKGEPLNDSVMMWGTAVNKAGSTDGGLRVIVNEYA